ncbi:unnamed protein product [Paramecium octaurelia]|uniref:Uncharacterized protein n=1 Tax=Paramecium octaurelia TaxID=43137 RepID=A0A8S1SCF9_PAROT|nr:unnamed protein product [Paramecium octaurelia]
MNALMRWLEHMKRKETQSQLQNMEISKGTAEFRFKLTLFFRNLIFQEERLKSAAESFITQLRINNKHPEALIEYYLKQALRACPNNTVANMRLGIIYQTQLYELNSAIESFEQVASVDPANYKAYYYRGQCYFQKGELDKGIECMNQSSKHNQSFGLKWKAIGNNRYEKNQPAMALKYNISKKPQIQIKMIWKLRLNWDTVIICRNNSNKLFRFMKKQIIQKLNLVLDEKTTKLYHQLENLLIDY